MTHQAYMTSTGALFQLAIITCVSTQLNPSPQGMFFLPSSALQLHLNRLTFLSIVVHAPASKMISFNLCSFYFWYCRSSKLSSSLLVDYFMLFVSKYSRIRHIWGKLIQGRSKIKLLIGCENFAYKRQEIVFSAFI